MLQFEVELLSYDNFKKMLIFFGGGVIIITSLLIFVNFRSITEVAGQLLFLVILLGAAYYGRDGGIVTSILATIIYASLFFPTIMSMGVLTVLPLILIRAAIYIFTGFVGGEICSRIKRFLTEVSNQQFIDPYTKLFNQQYCAKLIRAQIDNFERYNTIFSLVLIRLSDNIMKYLKQERYQHVLKEIAEGIVRDIRLVDEAARIGEDEFLIVLPYTPEDGAKVAASRVYNSLKKKLGEGDGANYQILAFPAHRSEVENLIQQLSAGVGGEI